MTPEQIAELERALDAAGVRYRSEVYRGGAHGYTMADTPAYDGPRAGALIDRRSSPSRTLASAS
jgi:dienelactone hydrolase